MKIDAVNGIANLNVFLPMSLTYHKLEQGRPKSNGKLVHVDTLQVPTEKVLCAGLAKTRDVSNRRILFDAYFTTLKS
jgi:hypothetical protein